jgi:hypothetical protein
MVKPVSVNIIQKGLELDRLWSERRRRPESAQAHFTLGYVQRYAGMLEESARQCGYGPHSGLGELSVPLLRLGLYGAG